MLMGGNSFSLITLSLGGDTGKRCARAAEGALIPTG
jgi:hypothetical protein